MQQTKQGKLLAFRDETRYRTMLNQILDRMSFVDAKYRPTIHGAMIDTYRFLDSELNLITIEGVHGIVENRPRGDSTRFMTRGEIDSSIAKTDEYYHVRFRVQSAIPEEETRVLQELEKELETLKVDDSVWPGRLKTDFNRRIYKIKKSKEPVSN